MANGFGGIDLSFAPQYPTAGMQTPGMSGGIFGGAGASYLGSNVVNPAANATQTGGFNWGNALSNIGTGIDAFSTLAGIYGMFKSLDLQKKSFGLAKKSTKMDYNANAQAFNNAVDDQYGARAASARYNGRDMSTLANYQPEARKVEMWGG